MNSEETHTTADMQITKVSMKGKLVFLSVALWLGVHSTSARLHVSGRWIRDEHDRVRIFHGFNSVEKNYPWYPNGNFSQVDLTNSTTLDLIQEWGFNAVRLGTMWSGVEPTRGHFNETYLQILGGIIKELEARGMWVILDMHQDVISSAFHSYDGIPRWLVDSFPPAKHTYPWPFNHVRFWAEGYLTEAVETAFQNFYDGFGDSHNAFARFWKKIAQTFNSSVYSNILGYELINEPWAGNIYNDPSLILPGMAGRKNLMKMYNIASAAIRSVEPHALIFYEPVTWGVMRNNEYLGTGFERVPGGESYRDRSVLSFHWYCWYVTYSMMYNNASTFLRKQCDQKLGPHVFRAIDQDVAQTGGSMFMTEFANFGPDGNRDSWASVEAHTVMALADEHFISWTSWDASYLGPDGDIQWSVIEAFSRPYARAIAGIPTLMKFDMESKTFILLYHHSKHISAPTEVYVPPLHYPNGFTVSLTSGFKSTHDPTQNLIYIRAIEHARKNNILVELVISHIV